MILRRRPENRHPGHPEPAAATGPATAVPPSVARDRALTHLARYNRRHRPGWFLPVDACCYGIGVAVVLTHAIPLWWLVGAVLLFGPGMLLRATNLISQRHLLALLTEMAALPASYPDAHGRYLDTILDRADPYLTRRVLRDRAALHARLSAAVAAVMMTAGIAGCGHGHQPGCAHRHDTTAWAGWMTENIRDVASVTYTSPTGASIDVTDAVLAQNPLFSRADPH